MNLEQRGWGPVKLNVDTINRLDVLATNRKESFDSIVKRLLDFWDEKHGITNTK